MSNRYSGIDVITCVQGNTVRKADLYRTSGSCDTAYDRNLNVERDRCVVYDFRREAAAQCRTRSGNIAYEGKKELVDVEEKILLDTFAKYGSHLVFKFTR